jgi:hypothetical protein
MAQKKMNTHGVSEREGKAWGHGQYANMPQEVVKSMYPKARGAGKKVIDDTITGIDRSIDRSESRASRNLSDQH